MQKNDLKSQHIAAEVTTTDNKTKKNASDILALENKLQEKEVTIIKNKASVSFAFGFFHYTDQSYLVYDCKMGLFDFTAGKISTILCYMQKRTFIEILQILVKNLH